MVLMGVLWMFAVCGCGAKDSYPRVTAAPTLGRTANCDQCGKGIASVGTDHLLDFQGVQYTVCGEACGKKLSQAVVGGGFGNGGRRR
jgi:hypothetical protein